MSAPIEGPPLTTEYLAESKGPAILAIIISFPLLAFITVALRLYTRIRIVNNLSHEDLMISLAILFSIGCSICQGFQTYNGMGRHVQAVTVDQAVTFLKVSTAAHHDIKTPNTSTTLYASIIFYNFALCLTKISILLQYLRIAIEGPIRMVCWGLIWFTTIYCIETFFAGIFQCFPVAKFWDARIPGRCVDKAALYYANAGINIVQDISLVVLPFFILRGLMMPKREKISLMLILGLGGFATIASICRLFALYTVTITEDIMWDLPGLATWSAMELNTGILCASLPTLRAFFIKWWPRIFLGSFRSTGRETDQPTANGHYYNMEGSVLVKTSFAVGNGLKDVEVGNEKRGFEMASPAKSRDGDGEGTTRLFGTMR